MRSTATILEITGNAFFRDGFRVIGKAHFVCAIIDGQLDCCNSTFSNPSGDALICDAFKVAGDVFLSKSFKCQGRARLPGVTIGGDLDCSSGSFEGAQGADHRRNEALILNRANIVGKAALCRGFSAKGEVSCVDTIIGGHLDFRNAELSNRGGVACRGDGAKISGAVFLSEHFVAEGAVHFPRAEAGGIFDCRGGHFDNGTEDTKALAFNGAKFSDVYLAAGFVAVGEVNSIGANIGGQFGCTGGKFRNPGGYALIADGMRVAGDVFLDRNFEAEGEVRFSRADIEGQFGCAGAQFNCGKSGVALNLQSSRIGDRLWLAPLPEQSGIASGPIINGELSLAGTHVVSLVDDADYWPRCILLDGFTFERFAAKAPTDAKARKTWLMRQPSSDCRESFRPQPFEQLIKVLQDMGHVHDAREIGYFKEYRRLRKPWRRWQWINPLSWLWYFCRWLFLEQALGHGYRPHRMVLLAVGVLAISGLIYAEAAKQGLFAPTNPRVFMDGNLKKVCAASDPPQWTSGICNLNGLYPEYTKFHPYVYSLDVILPIVNLKQRDDWQPIYRPLRFSLAGRVMELPPCFLRWLVWIETMFAWVWSLSLSAVAAGLIKRD